MEIQTLQPNKEDAGQRVDAWLAAHLEDLTRSAAARLLEKTPRPCYTVSIRERDERGRGG